MSKFIVTGFYRSGTTYMSSILNSLEDTFCFEENIFKELPKKFNSQEDFLCFSNTIDARFSRIGIPPPELHKKVKSYDEIPYFYFKHYKKLYGCRNIGLKTTLMSETLIKNMVDNNFKIIIMKRKVDKILRSYVNRIEPNLNHGAYQLQNFLNEINELEKSRIYRK